MKYIRSGSERAVEIAQLFSAPRVATELVHAEGQIIGKRDRQEDAVAIKAIGADIIAWLGDGLGGHPHGDRASREAVDAATDALSRTFHHKDPRTDLSLRYAVERADATVCDIMPAAGRHGPASTLIGGLFSANAACAYLANLGDSLCYRYSEGELEMLFEPQGSGSYVMHACGLNEQGRASDVMDYRTIKLFGGDRLLLASDGIDVLTRKEIVSALQLPTPQAAVDALLLKVEAYGNPRQDNTTVITIFESDSEEADARLERDVASLESKTKLLEQGLLVTEMDLKTQKRFSAKPGRSPQRHQPYFSFNAIDDRGDLFPAFLFDPEIHDDVWPICTQLEKVPAWICYRFFTTPLSDFDGLTVLEVLSQKVQRRSDELLLLAWGLARPRS